MSRSFSSLAAFGKFLGDLAIAAEPTLAASVTAMAANIHREVKEIIGDPNRLTPELADATVNARDNRTWGYRGKEPAPGVSPTDTLLWSGELRDSYEMESAGLIAGVGSDSDKALWHEVGTSKIPARMPLRRAADEAEPENVAILDGAAAKMLGF